MFLVVTHQCCVFSSEASPVCWLLGVDDQSQLLSALMSITPTWSMILMRVLCCKKHTIAIKSNTVVLSAAICRLIEFNLFAKIWLFTVSLVGSFLPQIQSDVINYVHLKKKKVFFSSNYF